MVEHSIWEFESRIPETENLNTILINNTPMSPGMTHLKPGPRTFLNFKCNIEISNNDAYNSPTKPRLEKYSWMLEAPDHAV